MVTKSCSVCGEEKPHTPEYFNRESRAPSGLRGVCKSCTKSYDNSYCEDNRERRKQYYWKNRERELKRQNKYNEENKEKLKIYYKENYERFKPRYATHALKRLSRINRLPDTLTQDEWSKCKDFFGNSCAYCGIGEEEHIGKYNQKLHKQRFIASVNKGCFTKENVIPSCKACSGGKKDKDFFDWYKYQEFYSQERERMIMEYLGYDKNGKRLEVSYHK